MKIFKLEQDWVDGYDTYDSCVVIAENEEEAITIHPSDFVTHIKDNKWMGTSYNGEEYETGNNSWVHVEDLDKIKVTYLGEAKLSSKKGVVCSSFNPG